MKTSTCPELPAAATLASLPADSVPFAPDSDPVMPFNVVVVYDDAASGKHAMNVLRRLGARLRPQTKIIPLLWRFDLLEDARTRSLATTDADSADLIIFATSEANKLPEAVNSWSAECHARKRGERLAMLTLFGVGDTWAVWIQDPAQIRTKRQTSAAHALQLPDFFERALRAA